MVIVGCLLCIRYSFSVLLAGFISILLGSYYFYLVGYF